ncbi:MAG: hypothetical protein HKO59_13715 [Phycisphaerales bacterium]|nr:hypothetical protein [Phycisphaerales bacterium]
MHPVLLAALLTLAPPAPIATVAERTDYRGTATHAETMQLLEAIADRSPRMTLLEIGRTFEDRSIPMAVIADPPVTDAAAAHADERLVVLAFGNIHAGEVCGKEALTRLARELAFDAEPLLEHLIVLLVPILNGDGNDRMAPENRPGQVGPELGMGERPNAQGLDLNRDWVKLEAPETRALVRVLTEWDPDLTIDTHTTNGSYHCYTLTYAAPLNPSGHAPSIAFVRDTLLPEVTRRMRDRTGYDSFFYGNFDRAQETWSTYSAQPRFGGPYRGLRGQMSVLSEAYAYASYRDRVLATHAFVREILGVLVERRVEVARLEERARLETIEAGRRPQPTDIVGLRHTLAAFPEPVVLRGWVMEDVDGERRPQPTTEPREYRVVHRGRFEMTLGVPRPLGYLIPAGHDAIIENLTAHGVRIESPPPGSLLVQPAEIIGVHRSPRPFQGHRLATLDVRFDRIRETRRHPPGTRYVPTAQPLGTLAVYLLEPQSEDGLVAWGLFDEALEVGRVFPVMRVVGLPR